MNGLRRQERAHRTWMPDVALDLLDKLLRFNPRSRPVEGVAVDLDLGHCMAEIPEETDELHKLHQTVYEPACFQPFDRS